MNETIAKWNEQLEQCRERAASLMHVEQRRETLLTRLNEERKRAIELEVQLDKEQADVDKLLKLSWSNMFHTILRSKDEQLEIERQQALSVSLKLQLTKQEIVTLEQEYYASGTQVAELVGADEQYEQIKRQKEQWILSVDADTTQQLETLEAQATDARLESKEWYEAAAACRQLVCSLEDAVNKLDSAANWGTFDMLGGGLISNSIKHSHIDDAKSAISTAQCLVNRLKKELKDVRLSSDLKVQIGGLATFADFFFDGLIADWIVQGKIKESMSQALSQLHNARTLLEELDREKAKAESKYESLKQERERLIEQFAG
ncbi:hypothetical protein [Paenibacillus sp. NEAU-GSW1]|uniref:hypothetical protein n=1 Tax=Paenibacillus sp. NEAU-GSW1 TaxID=2682486 RepID=UPI0012E21406|nr:hypothetical protein [Paenibacillus sp. NEAU-GSW1]MUT67039.1 hypothetical protein [Paenibacillus sp. NEAU-GSW1]